MQTETTCSDLRKSIIEWVLNNPDAVARPFRLPATLLDGQSETKEHRHIAQDTLRELGFEKRQVWIPGIAGKGSKGTVWVSHDASTA
jgi:hypothetical protein